MKNVTYQAECLHGRPCVRMQMTWSNVERLKHAHCERVKRERNM